MGNAQVADRLEHLAVIPVQHERHALPLPRAAAVRLSSSLNSGWKVAGPPWAGTTELFARQPGRASAWGQGSGYKKKGIRYWGSDLREGFDLTKQDLPGQCLFILVDPPYWNIIRYSDSPGDLSSCSDYEEFREMLMVCLKRCYDALVPGGRLAVLIGDVRRQGR
jgi:hypothetical protein